jgi:hypothetical protein
MIVGKINIFIYFCHFKNSIMASKSYHIRTDKALKDLKRLVRDFYSQQLQHEADKYWAEGKIGDHLLNEHLRTPYK